MYNQYEFYDKSVSNLNDSNFEWTNTDPESFSLYRNTITSHQQSSNYIDSSVILNDDYYDNFNPNLNNPGNNQLNSNLNQFNSKLDFNKFNSKFDLDNPNKLTKYSFYEHDIFKPVECKFETFDYNHGDIPLGCEYNAEKCNSAVINSSFSPDYPHNLPSQPVDHPDVVTSNFLPPPFSPSTNYYNNREISPQIPDLTDTPTLIDPEINKTAKVEGETIANDIDNVIVIPRPKIRTIEKEMLWKRHENPKFKKFKGKKQPKAATAGLVVSHYNNNNRSLKPSKSLPAWIIDDMKKLKQKEKHGNLNHHYHFDDYSTDIYKDDRIYSKRDDEDAVAIKPLEKINKRDNIMIDNSIKKYPVDILDTKKDIAGKNIYDYDEIMSIIDPSSKSLSELIEILDENVLDTLKIAFIRDSLTDLMKEVTNDMILAAVRSAFSRELSKLGKPRKHKGKTGKSSSNASNEKKEEKGASILGLDVYESDGDESAPEIVSVQQPVNGSLREKWSSHKRKSGNNELSDNKISEKIKKK